MRHQLKRRPRTVRCQRCKTKVKVPAKGRIPKFCSRNCRQRTYERNRALGPMMVMSRLAHDLDTVRVRDAIRAEVWAVLRGMGIEPPAAPPNKPKPKTHLRAIK